MSAILHTIITSIEDDRHRIHLQSWKKNMEKDKEKKYEEKKNIIEKLMYNRGKLHKKILNICKSSLKQVKISKTLKNEYMTYYIDGYNFPFMKWEYNRDKGSGYYNCDDSWLVSEKIWNDWDYEILHCGYYNEFVEEFLTEIENWLIELDEKSMNLSLFKIDLKNINVEFTINYKYQNGNEVGMCGSLI